LDGGGGGGLGPSSPLVDGGGSVRGWLLMAVCGGCWWVVVVLVQACRCCWALLIVCGWCSTLVVRVVISHQSPLVFNHRCSLFVVVHHCASFVGVIVIRRRFISHGDMAAEVLGGLPIGEG